MKSFVRTIKLFVKTPQILIAYTGLLGISNYSLYKLLGSFISEYDRLGSQSADSFYYFADIMTLCFVFCTCWFFISFEFMRKVKESHMLETLEAMGRKGSRIYVDQLLVLLLAIVVFAFNVYIYFLFGYIKLDHSPALVKQMCDIMLYDVLLLSLASSCMGIVVAQVKKRLLGYIVMLLIFFFLVPDYVDAAVDMMGNAGWFIYRIRRYINISPPNINNTLDALYGLPYETYRIMAMLLWIILGIYCLFRRWYKGRTKIAVSCAAVIAVISLGYCVQDAGSVLLMDETIYQIFQDYQTEETEEKKEDFVVSGYDMDIEIGKELSNHCTVKITDVGKTDEYLFTLYRGYRIKKITDEAGHPVDFSRTGDFVTVYGREGQAFSELTFTYRGSSNLFYSNKNACFLPGIFPYYPRAGFQPVLSGDGSFCVENWKREAVSFCVRADMPENFICNLPFEGGYYKGKADSLLLIGGNYDREQYRRNHCICYPMAKYSYTVTDSVYSGKLQHRLDSLMEFLGGDPVRIGRKLIICLPNSTPFSSLLHTYYDTDTYMILKNAECEFEILKETMKEKNRGELQKIFFEIQPGPELEPSDLVKKRDFVASANYTQEDELADTVVDKMEQLGVQKVAGEIYQYLSSDAYESGIEKDLDFVKKIH